MWPANENSCPPLVYNIVNKIEITQGEKGLTFGIFEFGVLWLITTLIFENVHVLYVNRC